jgi:hypothetical protein
MRSNAYLLLKFSAGWRSSEYCRCLNAAKDCFSPATYSAGLMKLLQDCLHQGKNMVRFMKKQTLFWALFPQIRG